MGILVSTLLLALAAQDAKLPGPQPGEKASGFKVFDVATRKEGGRPVRILEKGDVIPEALA